MTAPVTEPPLLALREVAHRFGDRWVLRGCSLVVRPGEVLGLLGRNGAGKTTLLRIAATLLRPSRGNVSVLGYELPAQAASARGGIGLLGHSPALYDDLTARENLRFACRMRGMAANPDAIDRTLAEIGLGSQADDRVRGFSAGMRRRLALGRIQLHPPRLLLLDEPYASLDTGGVELTNDLVRVVVREGGTVVIATHDAPRAAEVATDWIRIENGLLRRAREAAAAGSAPAPTAEGGANRPGVRS